MYGAIWYDGVLARTGFMGATLRGTVSYVTNLLTCEIGAISRGRNLRRNVKHVLLAKFRSYTANPVADSKPARCLGT